MGAAADLSDGCANPRAMVVKALNAVVVDATVVGSRRLVEVARVIVARDDTVVVHDHLLCPAEHEKREVQALESHAPRHALDSASEVSDSAHG